MERVLDALSPEDLDDLKEDGDVVVTCEFCKTIYRYAPALAALQSDGNAANMG